MGKKPNAANAAPKAAAAEPKSKAKAKAEPKPEQPPAEAPAPAAAPKAKAKAKEEPPAEVAPVPVAKATAKAGAKAAAKQAAAPPAKEPQAVEPKPKAKKKKPEPTPPPEPEDDDDDEEVEQGDVKKKKNRRGGQKKKGGDGEAVTNGGITKEAIAEAEAEKDPDYIKIRDRLGKTDAKNFDGNKLEELEKIIVDIREVMREKKKAFTTGAGVVGSDYLAAELQKLKSTKPNDPNVAEFQKQLDDARAKEKFDALKPKMTALRERAEEKRDLMNPGAKKKEVSADQTEQGSNRKEWAQDRLAKMDRMTDDPLASKTVELSVEVMKALYTPPGNLCGTYERKLGVVIDKGANKGKGAGKGAPAALPKEVTLWGASRNEVDAAASELKKLDFGGSTTVKVPEKLNLMREKLDETCDVIVIKRGDEVYIFGTKANVTKTVAKIEELVKSEGKEFTETVDIPEALVKVVTDKIFEWKKKFKVDQLRMVDKEKNPKMIVQGKNEKEVDGARDAIKDLLKGTASELCPASEEQLGKLWNSSNAISQNAYRNLSRSFSDLRAMHANALYIQRKENGVLVVGPKKTVDEVKKKINDLLKRVSYEPFFFELEHEQATRIFQRDRGALVTELMEKTGADLTVDTSSERMVIIGTKEQIEKAKSAIQAKIAEQGTVRVIPLNGDAGFSALKSNAAEKIKMVETQYKGVVLNTTKSSNGSGGEVTIVGPEASVLKAEKDVRAFVEKAEQREKDSVEDEVEVDENDHSRVRIRQIRDTIPTLNIWIDKETWAFKMKGLPDDIEKAKQMIDDMLNYRVSKEPVAQPKQTAAAPKKKQQEFKQSADDFPDLGGPSTKKKERNVGKWGKKAEEDAKQAKPQEAKEQFPTLGKKAAPAKEAPKAEVEEEEAGDFDDPLAMMSGMGAETFGEVKLLKEVNVGGEAEAEEEAGDFDDPLAMMAGMGAETFGEVKLMEEAA